MDEGRFETALRSLTDVMAQYKEIETQREGPEQLAPRLQVV